jgi:drug/metabolite transporter (DMT)-like permease
LRKLTTLQTILAGFVASFLFSATFPINRALVQDGGDPFWTATLRYGYVAVLLVVTLAAKSQLREWARAFAAHPVFFVVQGTVGTGVYYTLLVAGSAYAPAWVVSAGFQSGIITSSLILLFFGRSVPRRNLIFALMVASGGALINVEQAQTSLTLRNVFGAGLAFCAYAAVTFAMQMQYEAVHHGGHSRFSMIPRLTGEIYRNPIALMLFVIAGSIPFWVVRYCLTMPVAPTPRQFGLTAVSALVGGYLSAILFLYVRIHAHHEQLPALDACSAASVLFTLLQEAVFLTVHVPGSLGWVGISMMASGFLLFLFNGKPKRS